MAEIRIGHSQVYAEQLGLGANAVGDTIFLTVWKTRQENKWFVQL